MEFWIEDEVGVKQVPNVVIRVSIVGSSEVARVDLSKDVLLPSNPYLNNPPLEVSSMLCDQV